MEKEKLKEEKEKIKKQAPDLGKILRGSFRKVYLECIRINCKCHKSKKFRHGPNYWISYGKGKKVYTVYVGKNKIGQAKEWTENYNKLWETIEKISQINIKLLKLKNGRDKKK